MLALALVAGIGFALPLARAQGKPVRCVGDCNGTGWVEINELISCLNGALHGRDTYPGCFDICDANGDGVIRINEIVLGVIDQLDPYDGCTPRR